MSPPVLLTGATGFIGSRIARALAARGHAVHVLARASSDRYRLAGVNVRWHGGDIGDAASLERALDETRTSAHGPSPWVVHCAAVISYRSADRELLRAVNVGGTRNVVAVCRRAGACRLLHVSSVVAVGHARPGEVLDEDSPFNGSDLRCAYVDTKREAEELALAAAADLDVVAINPGAVFGPGSRGSNTVRFLRQLAAGRLKLAPPGALSVVGVDDVAEGAALALERGARGRRYILTESRLSLRELLVLAAAELGIAPPLSTCPDLAWRAAIAAANVADRLRPLELFAPQALRMLSTRFSLDSARARRELGWNPRPFPEVLHEAVRWLRAERLLPG
jgi:dihydroflavonol-4-reductase